MYKYYIINIHLPSNAFLSLCLFTGAEMDMDADFEYDYYTLRVGGLIFAGVIVLLSIFLLAGNKIARCGKSKVRNLVTNSF
uniref:FXYD domain-containing ion transport regulator n=1 Tax=Mastacembelus armatus TaxID=205130 RepID=A0A3Q3S1M2_9TELE